MSLIRSEQLRFPLTGSFTGSFVGNLSGSLTGTSDTASYAHTASYVEVAQTASYISGSNVKGAVANAISSSYALAASHSRFADTASYTDITYILSTSYADTASSADDFFVRGNLRVGGYISASLLHVDVISSSINYSTGSNKFGDELTLDVQEFTGSVGVTGSLTLDSATKAIIPNLTGSLYGTASWAVNALTASYALNVPETASYALQASASDFATTASFALAVQGGGNGAFTGSFTGSLEGTVTGSLLGTASYALSGLTSSYALTASFAANVPVTASYALTSSEALIANVARKIDGEGTGSFSGSFTGSLFGSASYAFFSVSGAYADRAGASDTAGTASWAQQAISSSTAVSASTSLVAISSSYAVSSSAAIYSVNAGFSTSSLSSSYAATASLSNNAITASYIATASTALFAITASRAVTSETASYALTSSVMVNGTASGLFTGLFRGDVTGTSSWSETASVAYNLQDTASQAWTASFVQLALSSSFTVTASLANLARTASFALTAAFADYAESVSASNLVGFTNRIVSGTAIFRANDTGSFISNKAVIVQGYISASEGFTGYLYDTASQAETASFANSFRIKSGAVILDGGLTIFNKSSSLSGSEINNGLVFRNDGPTGDTWIVYSEDKDRSLRFGITDSTHSAYRINNYLHQVNADVPVNVFSTADGNGGTIIMSLNYQGQGQPNQVWGHWTSGSTYTQFETYSFIDATGSFVGTASYASSVGSDSIKGDIARIASGSVTASVNPVGGLQVTANTTITGSLNVTNAITASNLQILGTASITYLHVDYQSSSVIISTGSNKFGDAFNDVQEFTGSVGITGSFSMNAASVATIENLTGSLYGTASWAIQALTSSITLSSSFADAAAVADLIDGGFY